MAAYGAQHPSDWGVQYGDAPAGGPAGVVTCVLADDDATVSELLPAFLAANGVDVVAVARDAETTVALIDARTPAVALVDVQMPGSGIELARRLHEADPSTGVVLYTAAGPEELLVHALEAGVRGIVQKEAPLADLVRALVAVARGGVWIDPGLSSLLIAPDSAERQRTLSARQREVLKLIADGLNSDEIAAQLYITPDTVRAHLRNAMALLGARTREHAVAKALRQSLIP